MIIKSLKVNPIIYLLLLIMSTQAFGVVGLAKQGSNIGRNVQYSFYMENFANEEANIALYDNLDTVFGAGNYSVLDTSIINGPGLVLDPSYDGSTHPHKIATGTLAPFATAQVDISVEITAVTDQGSGLGIYNNNGFVNYIYPLSDSTDTSTNGTDPDPSGDDNPDEDISTVIDLLQNPALGLAKNATVSGNDVTFDFYIENLGNREMFQINLIDDLDGVFGSGNYSIASAPVFLDDPMTMVINPLYNGSNENNLLDTGSSLIVGDTASIQVEITVNNVVDLGNGMGVYYNQAQIIGNTATGKIDDDLSDNGIFIDPNNNNNASDLNEDDPTIFAVGQEASIGLAKTANVSGSEVTFNLFLENLGNIELTNLSLIDDLNSVFGPGNYFVSAAPALIDDPGTLTLNIGFDGNNDTEILTVESSSLDIADTAQIQFKVRVLNLSDEGLGLGNYVNQSVVSGSTAIGATAVDLSDDGTDPDPNGDGNANQLGENDETLFNVAVINSIGISKEYINSGFAGAFNIIDLKFTITNYGNQVLSNINVSDNLDVVYGAGNYFHFTDPVLISGPSTFTYNTGFNGSSNQVMVSDGTLAPSQSVTFKITHWLTTITDQGNGLGIYQNQVTVNATDSGANPVIDVSHEGNNPDPNGDNNPNEMDPTIIDVNIIPSIGAATDVSVNANTVTFDLYIENLGDSELTNIALTHKLNTVFGDGNYTISSPPVFIQDPGTLVLNSNYDGSGDDQLFISQSSTLAIGALSQIRFDVLVDPINNNQNLGLGVHTSQSTVIAEHPNGVVTDLSDNGTDPDPNGNDQANEAGENDPTNIVFALDSPIGVAKSATVNGLQITYDLYLENLGTGTLSSVDLQDDLDLTFGAGNYSIIAAPAFIDDPGTLVLNPSYDGGLDVSLLSSSSTLSAGDTAQIQFIVEVNALTDVGFGIGIYINQAAVSGIQANGIKLIDLSDDGTDPDSNGNNNPAEFDEDDPTGVSLGTPSIGSALSAIVNGTSITYDVTIENLGNVPLSDLTMTGSLLGSFGFGNLSITQPLSIVTGPETFTVNTSYDGIFSTSLFFNNNLDVGEKAILRFQINVTNITDQGNGLGVYSTQFTAVGQSPGLVLEPEVRPIPGTSPVTVIDLTDDGIEADSNNNGVANDVGEDDPTIAIIGEETSIGLAKSVSVNNTQVTFDYYIENLGNVTLSNLSMIEDLDLIFGAGNYTINSAPQFIDDPGTIVVDGSYDGSINKQLLNVVGSTLAIADTAQIRMVIDINNIIDTGFGLGQYSTQNTISSTGPSGTVASDYSDDGTDPDPNGNGVANDIGEDDANSFSIVISELGVAKSAEIDPSDLSQSTVIFTYVIENLGSSLLTNMTLTDDLDAVFGAGNYTAEEPIFVGNGRNLNINSGFNGASDVNIITTDSELGANLSVSIQVKVKVEYVVDQGFGLGNYQNQATATAQDTGMNTLTDLSDDGSDPDPNGDGLADGMDEDDPTEFSLVAQAPDFTLTFSPSTVGLNGITTATYSIDNSTSPFDVTALDFSNTLPAGLVIATPSNLSNSCNGTATAVDATTTVSLTGGIVDTQSSCSITVDMLTTGSGLLVNTTGDLTSSSGNSGTASDTLDSDPPPVVTAPMDINMEATANLTPVMLGMATVTDDRDMGLSATPDNSGPFAVGTHTVTWTSDADSSGNVSTAEQTVTITDNTLPVITRLGQPTVVVVLGQPYNDAGATASDIVDGDLTNDIDTVNPVDVNTDNDYTVTYNVMDSAMNAAVEVTRLVVVDAPPSVVAPADINMEATGLTTAVALGMATVTDLRDMGLTATPDNTGPFSVGTHIITWTSDADSAGSVSTAEQTVTITDTTAPNLTLNGLAVIDLLVGDTYNDAGATASDLVDGDLTSQIIPTNPVDTSLAGVYTVNYSVTDSNGNNNSIDRTVNVRAIIGGTVSGLTGGESVVISDGSQQLTLSNGVYSFTTEYDAMSMYMVSIVTQPGGPIMQTCMLSNQTGNITAGNIDNIDINCAIDSFALNVDVTGLDSANSIVLSTNGQSLPIASDGSFNFPMPIEDGENYAVIVNMQPTQPSQECTVTGGTNNDGSGTIAGSAVLVTVNCVTNSYFIGGSVSGLEPGNEITLSLNNGLETIQWNTNAAFVFSNPLLDLSAYSVTVTEETSNPTQTCIVNNGSGNLNGQDIVDVEVICNIDQYFIGGQLTGLIDGDTVTIQNNGTDDLILNANGAFVFSTPLDDLSQFNVSILEQSGSNGIRCTIKFNSGTINGDDISNVFVNCDGINELIFKDGFEALVLY